MDHHIIRIAFKGTVRMFPAHPLVKHVMQEDVRQQRRDHAALRRAPVPGDQRSILGLGGRFEPTLDVQEHPRAVRVLTDRVHHQGVIDVVEEPPDVQVHDPIVTPAAPPAGADRVQR